MRDTSVDGFNHCDSVEALRGWVEPAPALPSWRRAACLGLIALLGACSGQNGDATFLPDAARVNAPETLLVATSRQPEAGPALYGARRSDQLSFARFGVSIPPNRPLGSVTWPERQKADPATDFLAVSDMPITSPIAFVAAVDSELRRHPGREAVVFVHGYNTTFAEGLYRQAQMHHDFNLPDLSVYYSWPSAGRLTAYVYDKESAIFAADGLADLLELLARTQISEIALVAHSMGGFVAVEALRLLELRQARTALARVRALALLAPDVDLDLFRQRAATFTRSDTRSDLPVYIFVSSNDRALRMAARIQGGRTRLGALADPAPVESLPVYLIDLTDVRSLDRYQHNTVATSPVIMALLRGLGKSGIGTLEDLQNSSAGVAEISIHGIEQATQIVVAPVARN